MTALSEDEDLLCHLFEYRFAGGRGLKGHSFGNLFLTAMHQITGDFAQAVKLSSEILAIRGRIFPATSANVTLEAVLDDGSIVRGESKISKSRRPIDDDSLASWKLRTASGNPGGHPQRGFDYSGPRFAVYQRHPQPARERYSRSN